MVVCVDRENNFKLNSGVDFLILYLSLGMKILSFSSMMFKISELLIDLRHNGRWLDMDSTSAVLAYLIIAYE